MPHEPAHIVVLFLWEVPPPVLARIEAGLVDVADRLRLVVPPDTDEETLIGLASNANVLVGWRPSDAVLETAYRARWIVNPGAGIQHLVDRVREHNGHRQTPLEVANGHGNAYATAQGALSLLLALTDRVVAHHDWMASGRWRTGDRDAASVLVRDRTLGLLGYGAVNRVLHRFVEPLGPQVHAFRSGSTPAELDRFLDAVDTLVVAVPLTDSTRGMLGRPELERLGRDGLLVNVGRGPVIDEGALYSVLAEGRIAGAAIDVWYEYDPEPDADGKKYPYDAAAHPFHMLPNVVLSPHRAASPFSDIARWDDVALTLRQITLGETPDNRVDLERGY